MPVAHDVLVRQLRAHAHHGGRHHGRPRVVHERLRVLQQAAVRERQDLQARRKPATVSHMLLVRHAAPGPRVRGPAGAQAPTHPQHPTRALAHAPGSEH